jgi:hypothetical protein
MTNENRVLERRQFLRFTLASAALVPLGGALASCAASGSSSSSASSAPAGAVSDTNPFGVPDNSTVDAVIFKGGYGIDYVTYAADVLAKLHTTVKPKVAPSTNIAQELQPRFVGGTPPDLVDNSGANAIGISTIIDQLEDLTSVIEAKNLEGSVIKDSLYQGVLTPGTRRACSRRTAGPRRRPGTRRWTWGPRPRPRASTSSSGVRRRPPTTRRWPSPPPSRRAATRCDWGWRTSRRAAGHTRRSRASSPP